LTRFRASACFVVLCVSGCDPQVVDAVPVEAGAGAPSSCPAPERDADQDGTPDCVEACPTNPQKIEPGRCGCDLPDVDQPEIASCVRVDDFLVHRYAFDGSGSTVRDSRGGLDGAIIGEGALLDGSGALTFSGDANEAYVDLPNGMLSALESATLEVWFTFYGSGSWERLFDFGDNDSDVEGERGSGGLSYLFLTPRMPDAARPFARATYQREAPAEIRLDSKRAVPTGALTHLAVTIDRESGEFRLYMDGELNAEKVNDTVVLSEIRDVNNWLGRSQFLADRALSAALEEFRIYSVALTPLEVRTSFRAGPNPGFFAD
jgi:hypothetical protein